jgi:hypothetical protein
MNELCSRKIDAKTLEKLEALPDADLIAKFHHPDHSEAARRAISEIFAQRSISVEETPWRPTLIEISVPDYEIGYLIAVTAVARWFRLSRATMITTLVLLLSLIPFQNWLTERALHNPSNIATFIDRERSLLRDYFKYATTSDFIDLWDQYKGININNTDMVDPATMKHFYSRLVGNQITAADLSTIGMNDLALDGVEALRDGKNIASNEKDIITARAIRYNIVPDTGDYPAPLFFLGLCSFIVFALCWKPGRFLVLRPFGPARMSRPLRRFMDKNIRFLGHSITLSDRGFRPSWLLILISLIPLDGINWLVWFLGFTAIKNSRRIAKVKTERRFVKFKGKLEQRVVNNFGWIATAGGTFNVRCKDEWWHDTVTVLMASANVILIDATDMRAGTLWELHRLREYGFDDKCLFVCQEGTEATAAAHLKVEFGRELELFVFNSRGIAREPNRFLEHAQALLARRTAHETPVLTSLEDAR